MRKKLPLLITLLFLIPALEGFSQNCSVKLRDAEALFNAGQVEEVPALLEQCLKSGFTKAEEYNAYQIIIRSYLFDDHVEEAEAKMLEFLRKNPEYKVRQTDNADFVYLFNKFDVKPVLHLGLLGGGVATFPGGLEYNPATGDPVSTKYSNNNLSVTGGISVSMQVGDILEFGTGIEYTELTFSSVEKFLNYAEILYFERQRRIDIPFNAYYFPVKSGMVRPYVKAGGGMSFNLSSTAEAQQTNLDINNPIQHTAGTENITYLRQSTDPFISAGFGCRLKLPLSYLFAEFSSTMGMRNQSKGGEPSNLEFFYGHTDDNFRLNTARVTVGFIYIFYRPTKKED